MGPESAAIVAGALQESATILAWGAVLTAAILGAAARFGD